MQPAFLKRAKSLDTVSASSRLVTGFPSDILKTLTLGDGLDRHISSPAGLAGDSFDSLYLLEMFAEGIDLRYTHSLA